MICQLQRQSIQKICSGQVIVDLCTALKELIENSLDAGATCIEVKLHDMGAEWIEVSDNGSGIEPSNFHSIALKHYTSKLHEFEDLNELKSFGFRGEALNSLCELSEKFTISTKHSSQNLGSLLQFKKDGRLESQDSVVRPTGTSVKVEKLFETLPVRRKEFLRTIKKQFHKALKVVQGYGIISVGVQLFVVNITKSGARQTIISIQSSQKIEDNIASVFGMSFLSSLIKFEFSEPVDNAKITPQFTYSGFVSKAREGVGRSDSDRQYVFCNGRPVDLPSIPKLFNEMWRKYEMSQKPAFIIDITAPAGTFDINISPDKREILLTNIHYLLDVLRVQLDECFSPSRNTFCLSKNRLAIETLPSPIVEEVDVKKYDRLFALDNSASNSNYSNCKDFTDVTLMKNERRSKKQHDKQANFLLTAGDLNVVNNISWKFNKDPWITLVMCMNQFQPTVSVSQPRSSQLNDDTSLPTYKRLLKKDFLDMAIIGQFNRGFIVAEVSGDLYIFDQHACDEKFKFEILQQSTTIHKQPLIAPRPFPTSPFEESIILENLQLFEQNGFHFIVQELNPPGHKLKLTTLPFCVDAVFDEQDIREFVSLIESVQCIGGITTESEVNEIPNLVIKNTDINKISALKLPRLVSLLASRSCRASVMIGTPLSINEMKSIVNNLSSIQQPWNCPHGRPTLRLLADTSRLEENRIKRKRKFMC